MNYPFTPTHTRVPIKGRRGSPVAAQVLSIVDGSVLYRVSFKAGKETIVRHTSASESHFNQTFREAA